MPKPLSISLARRFAYMAALLAGIAMLAIAGASWWLINQEHAASLRSLLKKDAELQATSVSSKLHAIAARMSELANSGLIVNTLRGNADKERLLIPYLKGIQRIHDIPVAILFADFAGREIASNGSFSEQELNWLREKLPAGQPASRVQLGEKGEELIAVEFIVLARSNSVEGALLYRIKLDELSLQSGVRLVYGKESEQRLHSQAAISIVAAVNVPPIYKHLDFAVLTSPDPNAWSVDWQPLGVFFILAVGVMVMVMVIILGLYFGKRTTMDLRALEFFARDVAEKGFSTDRAEAADSLEVASLAQSINRMLEHLKQEHDKLNDSEIMSRAITEGMAEGVITTTTDDIVLEANAAALQLFGYEKSELIGRDVSELVPERHRRHYKDSTAARAAQPEAFRMPGREMRSLRKDGSEFSASMSFADVQVGGRRLFTALIHDITERKQAEAARTQLAAIVQGSEDTIFSRTLDGIVTSWNTGAERMFGYTASEAVGRRVDQLILPPEMREQVVKNVDRVLHGERVAPYETRRMTKDGRMIDVLASVSPIKDGAGEVTGASVILHDISALKQAEAARRESEERFRAAFEQAGVGMGLRDLDPLKPLWLRVNQKLCDILGYTREELLRLTTVDITSPEDRDSAIDYNQRLLRGEIGDYSREKRYVRKDGEIIWVNLTLSTVSGPDGRPTHIISVIEDITEQKLAQERVITLNAELEQRVIERTRQLQATNKELETFSYSVSHDLRAPLRGIDGFSKLLLKEYGDRLDTKGSDYLQRIHSATRRMGELIDDLLQLSRVARHRLAPETVNLSQLASAILAELREREPERTVATAIQEDIVVQGDPRLLRIMLENLLGNAWKFTRKEPHPRIRVGTTEQDGKTVIEVGDNGAGFAMEYAGKLFGAFQRLHGAAEFEGTGIGLATVQRIVALHGGRVWAEAAVGKGAVFYLIL